MLLQLYINIGCFSFPEQFSRTVNGIVNSLSEHKRKEKPSSKRVQELSSHQLNHFVTVIYRYQLFFFS